MNLGRLMESEILAQPQVLRAGAQDYPAQLKAIPSELGFDAVLLAARGSSDNAALFARYLIEIHLGVPVIMAAPSVWTRYGSRVKFPRTLVIGISQSGAAPDVTEVIEHLRADGHPTLAITNTADSRLTRAAEYQLLLNAEKERSIAATKTFSATLLALYAIVRHLNPSLPEPTLPNDAWLQSTREAAEEVSGHVVRCSPVFSLGRGYGFSTAMETALKLMECALIPAKAYSSADFEHGPKALAGPGSAAIAFDGPKPNLAANGCQILPAPVLAEIAPEPLHPIWHIPFGQWLALLSARARGLDPDDARFLNKVTETL